MRLKMMIEDIIIRLQEHELGNDVETHELLEDAAKEIKDLRRILDSLGDGVLLYLLDRNKETVKLMDDALDAWEAYKDGSYAK